MTKLNDRYELLDKLGEGGMAEVYSGHHRHLNRDVAIKFIHPQRADHDFGERFKREAQAVARLQHPNIVQIYDFDQDPERGYFMVMELLSGRDLAAIIRKRREQRQWLDVDEAISITRQVAEALQYAHDHGVVHRDVKPSNIFLTDDNRVVVTDFGIAKLVNEASITGPDTIVGTPYYFAPEQASGGLVDHRADIYALGAMFYELLTGQVPYDADTTMSIIAQHINAPIPNPLEMRPDLAPQLANIIERAMAKDPDDRYQEFRRFIGDLDGLADQDITAVLTGDPQVLAVGAKTTREDFDPERTYTPPAAMVPHSSGSKRWMMIGAAVGVVLVAVLAGILLLGNSGDDDGDDRGDSGQDEVGQIAIEPAGKDEYLYLVADFLQQGDTETGVDAKRRVANALSSSQFIAALQDRFRVEDVAVTLGDRDEASALMEESGALMVIWGIQDAAGLELVFQARYPDETLNELRYLVPAGDDFGEMMVTEVAAIVPYAVDVLTNQQFILDGYLATATTLDELGGNLDVLGDSSRVVPVTAATRHVQTIDTLMGAGDFEGVDAALTELLAIAPQDPFLYYLRFTVNGFFLNRTERAQADARAMQAIVPDTPVLAFTLTALALAQDDYETLADLTDTYEANDPVTRQILDYDRILALTMLGRFEDAYEEIDQLDSEVLEDIFGIPSVIEIVRALYNELRGDIEAVEADHQIIRASRELESLGTSFPIQFSQNLPLGLIIGVGYASEVNDQTTIAHFVYELPGNTVSNHFLLQWRLGVLAADSEDWQEAFDLYRAASENAPVPFPIVEYLAAQLLDQHGDDIQVPTDACSLLNKANIDAETNPEFYGPLLTSIGNLQAELECGAEVPPSTPIPSDNQSLATSIEPAADNEYLFILTNLGVHEPTGIDLTRRVESALLAGNIQSLLGEDFRLETVSEVVNGPQAAAALAEETGALVVIWAINDPTGVELIFEAPSYPPDTLRELHYLIPMSDDFADILVNDLPSVAPFAGLTLTEQAIIWREDFTRLMTLMSTPDETFLTRSNRIIPLTAIEERLLEIGQAFEEQDYEKADRVTTDLLNIVPEDPYLIFARFTINGFFINRVERARLDAERLTEILPDTAVSSWALGALALAENDYEALVDVTRTIESKDDLTRQLLQFYRLIGLVVLGDFETAQTEVSNFDDDLLIQQVGVPAGASLGALLEEIRGDTAAASNLYDDIRASRSLQNVSSAMGSYYFNNPPVGFMLWLGYSSEVNEDMTIAGFVYEMSARRFPDDYLLNWRRAGLAMQAEEYSEAFSLYQTAADNAPVPFPIVWVEMAELVSLYPDEIQTNLIACELLSEAQQQAESNQDFYVVLLEQIASLKTGQGCE